MACVFVLRQEWIEENSYNVNHPLWEVVAQEQDRCFKYICDQGVVTAIEEPFMSETALQNAQEERADGEAKVFTSGKRIMAWGHNETCASKNGTRHAELVAIDRVCPATILWCLRIAELWCGMRHS